jgi:hypothetical protein
MITGDVGLWAKTDAEWRRWMKESLPSLWTLYDERVFAVGILEDGRIGIGEACDECFCVSMTPDDLRVVARELLAVAEEAERVKP